MSKTSAEIKQQGFDTVESALKGIHELLEAKTQFAVTSDGTRWTISYHVSPAAQVEPEQAPVVA